MPEGALSQTEPRADQPGGRRRGGTARMKAVLVAAASMAFALSPLMTDAFGGFDPEDYPNPVLDPPIQPAGYAFAIWGPIYLWLVASAGRGLIGRDTDPGWDATRWPLILSLAVGATWIPVAEASPVWATALIWVMLAGALAALWRAPRRDGGWLHGPLGLYAGWLSAASFVSLGLLAIGWIDGLAPLVASWATLAAALGFAGALAWRFQRPTYALAVAWALAAIFVQNGGSAPAFAATAGLGAVAFAALAWRSRRALVAD